MRSPVTTTANSRRLAGKFVKNEKGNIAILFALFLVPMLVAVGLAIDGLRALNAATTTANALDSAALAAARAMADGNLSDDDVTDVANDYFEANIRGDGKVSYSSHDALEVTINRETGEVTTAINTHVPTTLGQVAHIDKLSMRREATALAGIGEIEVGLMLDVTGSMNEDGKLDALKRATEVLVNKVIPEGRYADRVRIALAPYSTQVNMGDYANRVRDRDSEAKCVVEREDGFLNTDAAPGGRNHFHVLTEEQKDKFAKVRKMPPACPDAKILPLTSKKKKLIKTVNGYEAAGWTAGHLGIQWAWNLISENWGGVWDGASRPKDYGTKDLIKAVVLMTDGEFNSAFTGTIAHEAMKRESFGHAKDLCRNMEDKGIVIFSVAFDLDDPDAERVLEECASDEGIFLRAENEKELREAYLKIAIKLTQLRLSK